MSEHDDTVDDGDETPGADLGTTPDGSSTGDPNADVDESALRARLDALERENEQLRETYVRAKRSEYRRTALGLAALGVLAVAGAALFPAVSTVLLAIGATGLFGAVLTYYLTPERFVAASVGERVYRATARNYDAIAAELGLSDERVYVPGGTGEPTVRLFVPRAGDHTIPSAAALEDVFVVTDDEREYGIALQPSGETLYAEYVETMRSTPTDEPAGLAAQLTDALVEAFELVEVAAADVEAGRATVGIEASAYGAVDGFDHPVVSFLAVGFARHLEDPVTATVTDGDERYDSLVTLAWPAED